MSEPTPTDPTEPAAEALPHWLRLANLPFSTKLISALLECFDNDPAAINLFTDFLEHGHRYGVPVIPMYDVGTNAPELIAEVAAMNAVDKVLIGSSRRGALHHILKGSFQRRLESLLPPEIPVQVLSGKVADGDPAT